MKAFDRVSHKYLFTVLEKFGFGPKFIKWIRIFYTDIFSAVKCKGFLSKYFPVSNSVRQGCPISALLYVICAEPLARTITTNLAINPIKIPDTNETSSVFQHADDTTCTVEDIQSIEAILEIFEKYGKASGSKINKNKTEIMPIGKGHISEYDLNRLGVRKCDKIIKILGIYLGKDRKLNDQQNWGEKISTIKTVLNMWKQRHLNIHGRATVVSTLLLSRIWYLAMVQAIPNWALTELRTTCVRFIWQNNSNPVKYYTIIGSKDKGGLNIPDVEMKIKAFRMKFLARFLGNEHKAVWKHTLLYFLQCAIGFKLPYSFSCMFLKLPDKILIKLPGIYREMFAALNVFTDSIECTLSVNNIMNQPIFYNKKICYKGKPLSFDTFIDAGLTALKDLTYEVIPGFLPLKAIQEIILDKYPNISPKFIEKAFTFIKSCIPQDWFQKITRNVSSMQSGQPNFLIVREAKMYALAQCTFLYYGILLEDNFQIPTSFSYWRKIFPNCIIEQFAELIHINSKTPDMIDVDFKIFHNILYTNEKLHKFGILDSDLCSFCNSGKEDMVHMFLRCERLKDFISFIQYHTENFLRNMPNEFINTIDFNELFLLGFRQSSTSVNCTLLNNFLSHARMCLYKSRNIFTRLKKHVDLIMFYKYSFENYIHYVHHYYIVKNKFTLFDKYFLSNNTLITKNNDQLIFHW